MDSDNNATTDLTINESHTYVLFGKEDVAYNLGVEGAFNLLDGWSNEDDADDLGKEQHTAATNDSEETFAHLTTEVLNIDTNAYEPVTGATYLYTDGSGNVVELSEGANGVDVPVAYLNSLQILLPEDLAGTFRVKVEAKTVDYDEDGTGSVEALSGEAFLSFVIDPVADAVTLGVNPAYGLEDAGRDEGNNTTTDPLGITPENGIPLEIKPTSKDNDGSEIFTVKIENIPEGAVI